MTRTLSVREELNASKTAVEMYAQFKNSIPSSTDKKVYSLHAYINRFIAFKRKPTKNRKPISKDTLSDYELHLTHLEYAIAENKIDPRVMKIDDLTNSVAEMVFNYLKKNFDSEITHKKYFTTYQTFVNYLIKEDHLDILNPFIGWHFKKKESVNEVIYQKEFFGLLRAIKTKPEYQEERYTKGRNIIRRKMYYDWLEDGIKLGLFTGGRRQEIPVIRWTDIIPNRFTGKLPGGLVLLQDIKVTNIKQLDRIKIKPIEINDDLADFLIEKGYEENKGSEKYIIDPEENYTREFIKDYLSKSFAYYIKFVSERDLSFGCLRKTWFTGAARDMGDLSASAIGGHSSKEVTMKHYINKLETLGATGRFKRIFPENIPPVSPSKKVKIVK